MDLYHFPTFNHTFFEKKNIYHKITSQKVNITQGQRNSTLCDFLGGGTEIDRGSCKKKGV